jgi:hypothetical protein
LLTSAHRQIEECRPLLLLLPLLLHWLRQQCCQDRWLHLLLLLLLVLGLGLNLS